VTWCWSAAAPYFIAHKSHAACLSHEQFQARMPMTDAPRLMAQTCPLRAYMLSGDIGRGLLDALPPILTLSGRRDDPLHDVIGLLSSELATSSPSQTVLDDSRYPCWCLAIRACFQRSEHAPRWYQAPPIQARPSAERNARRPAADVDGAGAGNDQRAVTCCVRPDLPARAQSSAHAVPDRLAYDPGTRSSARRRVDPRENQRTHRLQLAITPSRRRFRRHHGLPTRSVAAKGDDKPTAAQAAGDRIHGA